VVTTTTPDPLEQCRRCAKVAEKDYKIVEDREKFIKRIAEIGIVNTTTFESEPDKLYVFSNSTGYGITEDCYFGIDGRLIESIGMDSLNESHRLYQEDSHHVLIFKFL